MSPESIRNNTSTLASDIWSFGVLCWEVFSFGDTPYPTFRAMECLIAIASGYRMPCPEYCPPSMYEVMLATWDALPEKRPCFREIMKLLKTVEERLESGLDKPRTVNPYKTAQQLREEGVIPDYADVPRMDGYDSVGQSRSGTLARGSADVVPANVPAAKSPPEKKPTTAPRPADSFRLDTSGSKPVLRLGRSLSQTSAVDEEGYLKPAKAQKALLAAEDTLPPVAPRSSLEPGAREERPYLEPSVASARSSTVSSSRSAVSGHRPSSDSVSPNQLPTVPERSTLTMDRPYLDPVSSAKVLSALESAPAPEGGYVDFGEDLTKYSQEDIDRVKEKVRQEQLRRSSTVVGKEQSDAPAPAPEGGYVDFGEDLTKYSQEDIDRVKEKVRQEQLRRNPTQQKQASHLSGDFDASDSTRSSSRPSGTDEYISIEGLVSQDAAPHISSSGRMPSNMSEPPEVEMTRIDLSSNPVRNAANMTNKLRNSMKKRKAELNSASVPTAGSRTDVDVEDVRVTLL